MTVHVLFQNEELQKKVCAELAQRKFDISTDRVGVKVSENDILLTDDDEYLIFIEQVCSEAKSGYVSSGSADLDGVLRIFSALVQGM